MQADTISYRSNQRSVEECRHIEQVLLKQHIGFKMNPHGELLNFSHSGDVPLEQQTVNDLGRMLLKIQPVLPAFLVVEGSTWETEQVIPNEKGNDGLMYKWFRVQKIQIEESKVLALIDVNIKYRMATEEASDRVSFSHEDFLLGAGQIRFNISEGLIEQADVEISGRIKAMAKDLDPELPPMRVRQMLKMRVIP
jgi:hypothetical protein